MGSFFDAPADAIALQQLFETTQTHPARLKLGHFFGARALNQPGGYWFDHAAAVSIVAHEMRKLVADGYRVIPQLKVPGIQDELLDFLVISPRGSVYAIIAHQFHPNKVRLTRQSVMAGGKSYAYPADLRAKADEVSLRLQLRHYNYTEVIPMLVVVDTAWLTARDGGRVRGATDYTFVRKIRKREEQRMRQGFNVLSQDDSILTPEFWQDTRVFEPQDYQRNVRLYRRWRWLVAIAGWASVFWSQVAFGLIAGGMLAVAYYLFTLSHGLPGTIIMVPPSR